MRFPALLSTVAACALMAAGAAQSADSRIVERDGYTLDFQDEADALDPAVADRMIETFFAVYPGLTAEFNPEAPRKVDIIVQSGLCGIACVGGSTMVLDPAYFREHPQDTDVVVHEAMHVVQAYGEQPAPGWLVEGVADYIRYHHGRNDAVGGWRLPDYAPDQAVEGGYRSTGRFLVWLEQRGHPGLVRALDQRARAGLYTDDVWRDLTGKTLPALWADYGADPALR